LPIGRCPTAGGKLESDKACEEDTIDCLSANELALEAFFVAEPEPRASWRAPPLMRMAAAGDNVDRIQIQNRRK
jgi:hypothetical protein